GPCIPFCCIPGEAPCWKPCPGSGCCHSVRSFPSSADRFPMYLESLATALPPHRYSQPDCLEALRATPVFGTLQPRSRALLSKVLGNGVSGVAGRHFCLPEIGPVVSRDAESLNRTFESEAPRL